jgi:hypothetical protein
MKTFKGPDDVTNDTLHVRDPHQTGDGGLGLIWVG